MKTLLYHTINRTAYSLWLPAINISFRKDVELLQLDNHEHKLNNWRAVMAHYNRLGVGSVISQDSLIGPAQRRGSQNYLSHQP